MQYLPTKPKLRKLPNRKEINKTGRCISQIFTKYKRYVLDVNIIKRKLNKLSQETKNNGIFISKIARLFFKLKNMGVAKTAHGTKVSCTKISAQTKIVLVNKEVQYC